MRRFLQLVRELPRNVVFYVFRVAPYPVRPGLMIIGNPDRRSPVLITTNYELTVRRVVRGLVGTDCYLLIAPAGGINVWCAAGGGHFSIDSIVSVIKTSRVSEVVNHRRLILPQLCGNGIDMFEVKRRTGWTAVFGPARAEDVPEYLRRRGKKTREMRHVSFTGSERLEMALAMWGSLTLRYTLFPLLILGVGAALWFAVLLAVLSLIVALGSSALPGRTTTHTAGVLALALLPGVLGATAWLEGLSVASMSASTVLLLGASFLVGYAFPGYSPHWQCSYSRLFFGSGPAHLAIVEERCNGCETCVEVCPVACFSPADGGTPGLVSPHRCTGCMACVLNCPTRAIVDRAAVGYPMRTANGCRRPDGHGEGSALQRASH
jgi:NAD-dependent dihydropyrimidine dehydrogenase PreA subunit